MHWKTRSEGVALTFLKKPVHLRDVVATLSQLNHPLARSALLKARLSRGHQEGLMGRILRAVALMSFCFAHDARQLLTSRAFGFVVLKCI